MNDVPDDRKIIFDEVGNFMGTGRRSPNTGQYLIAFGSRILDDDKYGDRACVLFHREVPIFRAKLVDRIHNACVDDAGNFCLQTFEWPKTVDGETFLFFRRTGEQYGSVFAPKFPSFVTLDHEGSRVLFATDEKLFFLQISPTHTIASFALPRHFVPTAGYVDESAKLVFLSQRGSDHYRFSFSGEFLDRRAWFQDFVASADGLTLYFVVRDEYCGHEDWTPDQYREAAGYIALALERGIEDSFHLSRSDVLNFLAVLRRRAGDDSAAAAAESSAEEALDGFRVVDQIEARLDAIIQEGNIATIREQITRLDKAAAYPRLATYRNYFGRLYKFKGSLHLALGDRVAAIAAFKQALEINPRVGCKKQLISLTRE